MDEQGKHAAQQAEEGLRWRLPAPGPGLIDWRIPNWWTFFLFASALVVTTLEPGNAVRDFLFDQGNAGLFVGGIGALVRVTTRLYAERIEQFEPLTVLEAKRANEQIKSLATAINALAGSIAVAVTFKQVWEPKPDYTLIVMAVGLAVWVHTGARHLLGLLKDESVPAIDALD